MKITRRTQTTSWIAWPVNAAAVVVRLQTALQPVFRDPNPVCATILYHIAAKASKWINEVIAVPLRNGGVEWVRGNVGVTGVKLHEGQRIKSAIGVGTARLTVRTIHGKQGPASGELDVINIGTHTWILRKVPHGHVNVVITVNKVCMQRVCIVVQRILKDPVVALKVDVRIYLVQCCPCVPIVSVNLVGDDKGLPARGTDGRILVGKTSHQRIRIWGKITFWRVHIRGVQLQ